MPTDYQFFSVSTGILIFSGSIGGIIDKQGNVYKFAEGSATLGISTPVGLSSGSGIIETKWKNSNDKFIEDLSGSGVGLAGSVIISASVSKGRGKSPLTMEIGLDSYVGKKIAIKEAEYIGNIYD